MAWVSFTLNSRAGRDAAAKYLAAAPDFTVVAFRALKKPPVAERLMASIEFDTNGGCWLWSGRTNQNGYGIMGVDNRDAFAHRVSHERFIGPVPAYDPAINSIVVMHTCDVPCCINPAHLRLATQLENIADRGRKGRTGNGRHIGEAHPNAKIAESIVRAIRADYDSGKPRAEIAAQYGISANNVALIGRRRTWRHV